MTATADTDVTAAALFRKELYKGRPFCGIRSTLCCENIVAAGLADKCEIQLSYAIGVAQPTSINVETFGTGKLSDTKLVEIIRENFDLRPAGIIRMLDLRRPIYKQTAAYGHFGRTDVELPWEKLDKVDDLKNILPK